MKLNEIFESKRHFAAEGMKCLTKADLDTLARHLPSISQKDVDDILYDEMYLSGRMPGSPTWKGHKGGYESNEELEYAGLCAIISDKILELLKDHGAKRISGRFEITPNKGNIHTWLEIDNKIIDFTASQFNPWLDHDLPDLLIIDKNNPLARHYVTTERADEFEYTYGGDKYIEHYLKKFE